MAHRRNSKAMRARLLIASVTCFTCLGVVSAEGQSACNQSLWDRNLVEEGVTWRDISQHSGRYYEDTGHKHFAGPILAYVTPWNGHGYEVAKTFRRKFTHVAPVWYQLRRSAGCYLTGQHDVDQGWLDAVRGTSGGRRAPGAPKIVPRVLFEVAPMDLIGTLLSDPQAVLAVLAAEALEQKFDGWVLEVWSLWDGLGLHTDAELQQRVFSFVHHISAGLHSEGLELHLAVPPAVPAHPRAPAFTAADLLGVWDAVDGLSVMTYDHAKLGPGPNAPLQWVTDNADALVGGVRRKLGAARAREAAKKVMLGLNLYGVDFALGGEPPVPGQPTLGRDVLARMRRHRPKLRWDAAAAEHSFAYAAAGTTHRVWYPTPLSLHRRLELARQLGVGVSLWEIGQGLDFFYDLF